jgi:hypothetical protein
VGEADPKYTNFAEWTQTGNTAVGQATRVTRQRAGRSRGVDARKRSRSGLGTFFMGTKKKDGGGGCGRTMQSKS